MMNTRNILSAAFAVALSAAAFGCGGSDGKDGANGQPGTNGTNGKDGLSALVVTTTEPAGANCAKGGTKVEVGMDADGDGILAESEIASTQYICNGADGQPGEAGTPGVSPAITTATLAVGEGGCVNGGVKITITSGETTTDRVVCNGVDGSGSGSVPTIATSVLSAGNEHCANGGVQIDVTSNGTTTSQYVCNGANGNDGSGSDGSNGHNSLINMTDYTGDECASGSGVKIEIGLDLDDSGTLDAEEVTATKYVCNGTNGGDVDPCADVESDVECVYNEGNPASCFDAEYGDSTEVTVVCADHPICEGVKVLDEAASRTACANEEDPCAGKTSDGDCTGDGPNHAKTCLDAWGEEVTAPSAYVVCVENAQCPGVFEEDIEATEEVCYAEPNPPAPPINWCNTQWPKTLPDSNGDKVVYARIPTADISSITGVKLIYGTDTSSISTWASIDRDSDYSEIKGEDTEYKAIMDDTTYAALANGTYYYAMAITGDGTNWFYCPQTGTHVNMHNTNDVDEGGTPTQTIDTAKMGTMVIEGSTPSWDNHETWTGLETTGYTSAGTDGSFESQDVAGLTWKYQGATYAGDFGNSAVTTGILMNKEGTRFLDFQVTSGIGEMKFIWGRGGASTKKAPKVKVSVDGETWADAAEGVCTVANMETTTADPQTGTCTFNQTGNYYIRFTPNGDSSSQVIIGDVMWMNYSAD